MSDTNTTQALSLDGIRLPNNRYTFRCIDEEYKVSAAGNPMIARKWEIVEPETIKLGKDTYKIAGLQALDHVVLTDKQGERNRSMHKTLDLSPELPDSDSPSFPIYKGIVADCIAQGEEFIQRQEVLNEETGELEKGEPITDREGKPIKSYSVKIGRILARVKALEVNMPY